jgi:hypothetical protein
MKKAPIITRDDLLRELEELGLVLVEITEASPTVRVDVTACAPSDVVRRPPVEHRVEALREQLAKRGVLGIRWVVEQCADSPYRAAAERGRPVRDPERDDVYRNPDGTAVTRPKGPKDTRLDVRITMFPEAPEPSPFPFRRCPRCGVSNNTGLRVCCGELIPS